MTDFFGRVGVLMGGDSSEREISLLGGAAVLEALQSAGVEAIGIDTGDDFFTAINKEKIDRAFIMLHGGAGEDGRVQAALELMSIPYTGSCHAACALAMDKVRSKLIWMAQGLPTPDFELLHPDVDWQSVIERLGICFVKPVKEGSSIGINKASTAAELKAAYEHAVEFDEMVMAEQWIDGPEYTVPILNNKVLPVIELKTKSTFYDYDAKYEANDNEYLCPCDLNDDEDNEIRNLCGEAFQLIGCEGWGRIDLMRDSLGKFWLLEVNTVPGMTSHSLVPKSAAVVNMDFVKLVVEILKGSMGESFGSEANSDA